TRARSRAPARCPPRGAGRAGRRRRRRPSRAACAPGTADGVRCRRGCCPGRTRPTGGGCCASHGQPRGMPPRSVAGRHPSPAPRSGWAGRECRARAGVEPGVTSLLARTRFSVLDRSRTREGHTDAEALRDTVRLAQEAERLGYHRFWVSEHHGVPGVAGSAPTVLAAAVAGATRNIRVGTGGVMLPNHRPFVVAEPYVVVSGTVAVAATPEEARRLLVPEAWSMAYSRTHGTFPPLPPAERGEARSMTPRERGFYESGLTGQLAGTEEEVAHELESLLKDTDAQEVLVTTSTYDREALLDSYR